MRQPPLLGEVGLLQTECTNWLSVLSARVAQRDAPCPIRQPLWRSLSSSLVKRKDITVCSLLSHRL